MSSARERVAAALYVFDGGDAVPNEHALGTSEVYLNRADFLLNLIGGRQPVGSYVQQVPSRLAQSNTWCECGGYAPCTCGEPHQS